MTVKKFAVGFVLTLVMMFVLGASALLFSARDFQFGLAQVSPETNGFVAVDRLFEVDAQVETIHGETASPRGELLQIQSEIAAIDSAVAADEARLNEQRAAIAGDIAAVEADAAIAQVESAAAALEASALNARIMSLAARPGLSPANQQRVASLRGDVQSLAELEAGVDARDAQRRDLVARERAISGQVAEADRRIYALQQSVVPNYEHYQRVLSEVRALRVLSPLGVGSFLVQGHPAVLSTLLVVTMGALGAILYLFPAYLNRKEPVTFSEIAVRLIFGMCAAIAFYVLANATVAGFSVAGGVQQASTASTLNPFTVSLIGIVAGVLAEDLAKWIQDRGKGIFTQGVQTPTTDAAAATPTSTTAVDPGFTGVNPHGGPMAP